MQDRISVLVTATVLPEAEVTELILTQEVPVIVAMGTQTAEDQVLPIKIEVAQAALVGIIPVAAIEGITVHQVNPDQGQIVLIRTIRTEGLILPVIVVLLTIGVLEVPGPILPDVVVEVRDPTPVVAAAVVVRDLQEVPAVLVGALAEVVNSI
jgi:hypothetical protein